MTLEAKFADKDSKKGDLTKSPDKITWTVDVNTELNSVTDAHVTDTIPQYLTLDNSTIKINKLKVSANGSLVPGDAVKNVSNTGGNNLDLNLGNINGAYRIVFETTINAEAPSMTFENTVNFNGKDIKSAPVLYENLIELQKANTTQLRDENLGVSTNIGANTSGNPETIAPGNEQTWVVTINDSNTRKSIMPGMELRDSMEKTGGQHGWKMVLLNSLKVEKKAPGATTWQDATGDFEFNTLPTTTPTENLSLNIRYAPNVATTDAYRIIYKTQDSAQNHFYGNSSNVLKNKAQLFSASGTNGIAASAVKEAQYAYQRYNTREFFKNFLTLDYQKQTITTQFVVRVPNGNAKSISIFDYSGSRINLREGENLTVTKYPLTVYSQSVDKGNGFKYIEIFDKQGGEPTTGTPVDPSLYHTVNGTDNMQMYYNLFPKGTQDVTSPGLYVIEVETPFNADLDKGRSFKDLHNNATVQENGINVSKFTTAEHVYKNNPYMLNNGFKKGTYDFENREITWEVGFNYNIRSLKDATITDTLEGNHVIDKTSFKLERWDIGVEFEGNVAGKNYTKDRSVVIESSDSVWASAIKETANGFTLDTNALLAATGLQNADEQAYILTYKTKMQDDLINQAKYDNDFNIKYVNDMPDLENSTIEGTAEVPRGGEYIEKEGSNNGRIASWTLDVNAAQSTVEDIKITDVLSDNQILIPNTIKVYEATVSSSDAALVQVAEVEQGEGAGKYKLAVDGNTINIILNGEITKPYLVKYDAYVLAADGQNITNKVSVSGKQIASLQTGVNKQGVHAFAMAGASAVATGVVTITKTAADTKEPLEGVVFSGSFEDEEGTTHTLTATTDEKGIATFERLPLGVVFITETEAAPGYILDKKVHEVNVTATPQNLDITNEPESKDTNTTVTLTKVDEADSTIKLSGAEFALQKKNAQGGYDYVDVTGQVVTEANKQVWTTSSDSTAVGEIMIENLPFGEYQFVEVKAPTGYTIDTGQDLTFELKEGTLAVSINATNTKQPPPPPSTGTLTLTKVDATDTLKRLPGAVFKLQKLVDNYYADVAGKTNLVTDANGQIILTDLPLGDYQFVETKAPEAYDLDATPIQMELTATQLADAKQATNKQTPKKPGSIEILKIDGNDTTKPLQGAEFDLLLADGSIVKVGPTDADGKATVDAVPVGTHQLKETKAPADYVLNTNAIAITVTEDTITTQTVSNFPEPQPVGALEIMKVDATTKDALSGAQFLLSNGSVSYKIGPTNANGAAKLTAIPVGTYTLTEVKAPAGYEMKTKEIVVTITKDQTTSLTVENVKLPPPAPTTGDLKIVKVDAANKTTLLAGATFTIEDGVTTKEVTTNSQGEAMLTDLTAGTYVVTETKAPAGYVLNSTPQTIRVEAGKTATLTFENVKEVELGSLVVTKVDSANNNSKLAGAQFDLILADGTLLKLGPTDANGVAKLENIPVGTHKLIETVAPTGYTLSTEELTVTIGKNTTATVTVRNEKALPAIGTLRLTKVDAADASIRLGGATFTLTNGEQTQTIVTDASGLALVTGLAPGNYILTETVAPTGYQLNEKSVFVTIRANEMTEYTFSNTKKPVTPTPNPNEENPNNGTNPDAGSNPKPDPKPKDPNALTPDTGTNPNTGTNPGKTPNYVGGTTGTNTPHKKPSLLPQTNGESTMVYTLLGILLIVGSAALLFARRRKTN